MLPLQPLAAFLVRGLCASTLASVMPQELLPGDSPAGPQLLGPQASIAWIDVDGDDRVDLFVSDALHGDRLLVNQGGGEFSDRFALSGLDAVSGSRLAQWSDFDGDGLQDVYRVGADLEGGLWRNMGDGTFAEVDGFVGLPLEGAVLDARWVDVDGDLNPDLQLVGESGVTLYANRGGRSFEASLVLSFEGAAAPAEADEPVVSADEQPAPPSRDGRRVALGPTDATTNATSGVGLRGTKPGASRGSTSAGVFCSPALVDQASAGACLLGSSVPTLGQLYPLSTNLFVSLAGNVGIGTTTPADKLHVNGTLRTSSLRLPTGAQAGHVLTSDATGTATWQPAPGGGVGGSGTPGYLPKFTGSSTLADSWIYDTGSRIGIGVTNPILSTLHLKSWLMDASLRLEGTGTNGVGGMLAFGDSDLFTYIEEDENNGLTVVAQTGIALGPGNVGIHTASHAAASHALTVAAKDLSQYELLRLIGPEGSFGVGAKMNFGDSDYVEIAEDIDDHLTVRARLGTQITTDGTLAVPALEVVQAVGSGTASPALKVENTSTGQGIGIFSVTNGNDANAVLTQNGAGSLVRGFVSGALKFEVRNDGRVVARSVEITGGSDLVEAFVSDVEVEPGTVMCIDPENPGQLTPSREAYDARVAGVVSGAGGVQPGLHLRQEGVVDGDVLVAMTGRVYVRCSAENGAIRPGDLLTTAELAGHAMRASDPEHSFGAVIGKAMTALDEGTGLVLVLVNLQ